MLGLQRATQRLETELTRVNVHVLNRSGAQLGLNSVFTCLVKDESSKMKAQSSKLKAQSWGLSDGWQSDCEEEIRQGSSCGAIKKKPTGLNGTLNTGRLA